MDLHSQTICKEIVEKCRNTTDIESFNRLRNELFTIMFPFIQKWLKAYLARRKIYLKPEKLLSVSWDVFCYCLATYKKPEIPLPSHFMRNTIYFVLKCLKNKKRLKKINSEIKFDDVEDVLIHEMVFTSVNDSDISEKIMSGKDILRTLRNSLNEDYRKIFDDALTGSNTIVKSNNKNKYIPLYRYQEAKKVFGFMIEAMLVGDSERQ